MTAPTPDIITIITNPHNHQYDGQEQHTGLK